MPPYLGFGLGLRNQHYQTILETKPAVDWWEAITEDYLVPGGCPLYYLDQIRQNYPLVLHGVSLSIGSADAIDYMYLKKLKALADRLQPSWISDHLCWTGVNGVNLHDLMPLPYTYEAIKHVVEKIKRVQDFLGQQILLENVSSYVNYTQSELTEWDFFKEITERADCLILLDINNVYVSAYNHGFNPEHYLYALPKHRVCQFHLAGHENNGKHIIDTHNQPIIPSVWDLYAKAIRQFGKVSTLIERDDNIPELAELITELEQAKFIAKEQEGK